ncbi:hypothetical protein LWM68_26610 [Niabella sp. W65]|nr:hypothetical protein [Niabella sp. W65]MCH7366028.1 hypothetical protein [Niabella sp. W65]ULT41759.1 hypothetical protein KRR40_45510 [Niabella sp. I65]
MRNLYILLLPALIYITSCGDKEAGIDSYQGYITIDISNKNETDGARFVLVSNQGRKPLTLYRKRM